MLDRIPTKDQPQAKPLLTAIPYAGRLKECEKLKSKFQDWCLRKHFPEAARLLDGDWERRMSFCSFPQRHREHLSASNVVESPFAALRLRTNAAKRFKEGRVGHCGSFKLLLVADKHFRLLNAQVLMRELYRGVGFEDGERVPESSKAVAT